MWTAHVDDKIYPLMPTSRSMVLLVRTILTMYPGSKVWIHESISNNPYLANYIVHCRWMRETPDPAEVQIYLDHPGEKICDHCECEAWFNPIVRSYQCVGCNYVSYSTPSFPQFFKLSRWAKWQGGNAHRSKEAIQAIVAKKKEIRERKEREYVEKLKVKYNLVEKQ
jgi:hypothetical protein